MSKNQSTTRNTTLSARVTVLESGVQALLASQTRTEQMLATLVSQRQGVSLVKPAKASKGKARKAKAPVEQVAVTYVNKGNREAFVKVAPWAKSLGAKAIQQALAAGEHPLPAGWALPTGELKARIKAARAGTPVTVATVTASQPAKVRPAACDQPRRADGTTTPKREWALREALAATGKYDRFEIDAKVAEALALIDA